MRQHKTRILFEIPHLHFCYKSKDSEHFCLRGGDRVKERGRKSVSKIETEGERVREREEIVKAIAVAASSWHR